MTDLIAENKKYVKAVIRKMTGSDNEDLEISAQNHTKLKNRKFRVIWLFKTLLLKQMQKKE